MGMSQDERFSLARFSETQSAYSTNGDVAKDPFAKAGDTTSEVFDIDACVHQLHDMGGREKAELSGDFNKVLTRLAKLKRQMSYVAPQARQRLASTCSQDSMTDLMG